jgi:octopine/nopaline transport system ATP-binding protein
MASGAVSDESEAAADEAAEAIHVENLHKKFGDLHVLKGVSLSARDGEVIAIIGGSGSGKSTLLRCINCLENPTSGIIRVNGEEIRLKHDGSGNTIPADRRQIERIRSKLGMVFQSFNLWSHMTLLENVIEVPVHVLGVKRSDAIANAEKLLARVGLAEKRDVYPAASSSAARLPARSPFSPASCCSTSRPPRLIPNWSAKSCASSPIWPAKAAPWFWSRMR